MLPGGKGLKAYSHWQWISAIERGRKPSLEIAERIAAALGQPVGTIYEKRQFGQYWRPFRSMCPVRWVRAGTK